MNPFLKEKRNCCFSVLVLLIFLFFSCLSPVFAAGRPIGHGSGQELETDDLNQPLHNQDQLNQKLHKPDQQGNLGKKPDSTGNLGKKPDDPGNLGKKPDSPGNLGKKPDDPGNLGKKPDNLGKKPDNSGNLGKKPDKPDPLNHKKPDAEKLKAGDIALQITNDTDFALIVRASVVDASERVNLAKAKSVTLAPHARESIVLTLISAGKVSLSPMNSKHDVEKDSKILLTINRGKETRRMVVDYTKSAGMIVLGKDLFAQDRESPHQRKLPSESEETDEIGKLHKKPDASSKGQIIYVINQTGIPLNYNALLKPSGFDSIQGELKPGANVLKFPAKKAVHSLSKEPASLILQMKYDLPGSPAVSFKKEALDLDAHPTVTITRTIMGEPKDQTQSQKKPR